MSFEYMTKEGCGSGVFLFRPLLALAALWSSTQMQLRRCLKCGWGIVPETLHLSLPLLSLPMFFVASTSPAEFGQQFSFPQRFAFLSSVLSGLPSLLSTTQPEAVVAFGLVFAVSQRCEAQRDTLDNDTESDDGVLGGLEVMAHLA